MRKSRTHPPREEFPLPQHVIRYSEILAREPHSLVFASLAEAYRKFGMVDEAIRVCRFGLEGNPAYTGGRLALARAWYDKGRPEEAGEELVKVLELRPDNLAALRLMGLVRKRMGAWEAAHKVYQTILFYHPADPEALDEEAYLSRILNTPAAETGEPPPETVPVEPVNDQKAPGIRRIATRTMAELYVKQGYLEDAVEIYKELLDRDPGDEELRMVLTELQFTVRQATARGKVDR